MPRLPRAVFAGFAHHVTQRGNRPNSLIRPGSPWQQQLTAVTDWSAWLAQTDDDDNALNTLRLHANKRLPCGDSGFVARQILQNVVAPEQAGRVIFAERVNGRFLGLQVQSLPIPARQIARTPPVIDQP